MNSSREINDNVNSIEWFDAMGPDNSNEAAKEQSSNDATNLLYSDNIVAVCEAMNSEVPQHRVMTDEERHERRLESNRLSARRRRQRHASQVHDLQEQVRSLSSENLELRAEHDRLQALMRRHEGVIQWDNRCDDAVNWELKDSDEKEDDQQPQQPPLVYGEQISGTLMDQPTVALSNVPLERRGGDENQAFVDSRYQSLQDNWSLEHRVGNNESALTIHQESVFDSFAAFSNVAEQRHFMVNNPLDSVGHDNVNQERHTLVESRNTNLQDSQRNNANYAVAVGDEPESSAGSISMPGDVSEYFDMLFHSQEPATNSNETTWHKVHNRENPLAPDPNFHSIDTLTPPNVPRVHDWHPNSAGDDSLSSCPLAFANEVSNEQNVGDLGPVTEDIFDSK